MISGPFVYAGENGANASAPSDPSAGELVVPVGARGYRILCQAETRRQNKTRGVPRGGNKLRSQTRGEMEKRRTREQKKKELVEKYVHCDEYFLLLVFFSVFKIHF